MVGEEIPVQREDNIVNMETEEGDEGNDNVNKKRPY